MSAAQRVAPPPLVAPPLGGAVSPDLAGLSPLLGPPLDVLHLFPLLQTARPRAAALLDR